MKSNEQNELTRKIGTDSENRMTIEKGRELGRWVEGTSKEKRERENT